MSRHSLANTQYGLKPEKEVYIGSCLNNANPVLSIFTLFINQCFLNAQKLNELFLLKFNFKHELIILYIFFDRLK